MTDTDLLAKLITILCLSIGFFLFCYLVSPRKAVPWLIFLSPFQVIDTPYTSSSVVLTYAFAIAFILKGRMKFLPMLGAMLAIMSVYIVSTAFAHPATHTEHWLYIFNYVSAILLFYIVYNFVRDSKDISLVTKTLIVLNILVVLHSIIQVTIGPLSLFGLEEVRMHGPRHGEDARLSGPYGSVTMAADFFVMYIFVIAYLLIHVRKAANRNLLYILFSANLACLLMTANRGGFLMLIGGGGLFLYMFRSLLGVKRTVKLSVAALFLLALMSVVVVNFTDYGLMYERLAETEFEQRGVPDTRVKTWSRVVPGIGEKPLIGHGPRFRLQDDFVRSYYPGYEALTYPHNLYLFLLYTVGFIGFSIYMMFFFWIIARLRAVAKHATGDMYVDGFVKLGILLMVVFLSGQLKIEFLRFALIDYTHFIFIFFAIWLAIADMARADVHA